MSAIRGVINRIGLGHADHGAVSHPGSGGDAQRIEFPGGKRHKVGIGGGPEAVSLEAEVLHAETGHPRFRNHGPAPVVEVLDPPHLDSRGVDVDPVVGEEIVPFEHESHHQEVPVAEPPGRGLHRGGHGGREGVYQLPHRHGGNHMARREELFPALRVPGPDSRHPSLLQFEGGDRVPEENRVPHLHDPVPAGLPHLPRTESGVLELMNQRLDRRATPVERGGREDRPGEREPLDPLGRPLRPDLGAGHAPDLLGVGLEEDLEEPLPEPIGDPLFEVFLHRVGTPVPAEVAQHHPHGLDHAEPSKRVAGLEGIVEILPIVENPGHARHGDELVPQNLVPEVEHRSDLGEEAMPPDIEAVSLVSRGAGDASDHVVGLEHGDGISVAGQEIGCGEPRRTRTDHHDRISRPDRIDFPWMRRDSHSCPLQQT